MNELINGNAIKMTSIEIAELVENRAFSCAYQPRAFRDMRQRQDGGLHRAALGLSMSARTGSYHQKGKYDVQYHPD